MNVIITAIGKRVQLLKHLKENFNIIGVDSSEVNAGRFFLNKFYKISKFNEDNYIKDLLNICKKEKVKLIIPLYELEFIKLLENYKDFKLIGTKILLSDKKIIEICNDKKLSYKFLRENNILTAEVFEEVSTENMVYPLIIKPKDGMGSNGVFKINNKKELEFFKGYVKNAMVQRFIEGEEYTVDVLCDLEGNPIYIVPRKRLEVRAGEVSKSKIVKNYNMINLTKEIISKFNFIGDGLKGPLTFQFIKNKKGEIYFLELNPRFGGGVPISFEAGANYGEAIRRNLSGEKVNYSEDYREITMIRYDEAIFY